MAFSTQKQFFNVPFMNEAFKLDCKKACVKLKRYESTADARSWAHDERKQSKFLSDLVTCSVENVTTQDSQPGKTQSTEHGTATECASSSKYTGLTKEMQQSDYDHTTIAKNEAGLTLQAGGDSLLECANVHLAEYQKVLKMKVSLEKQLEVSNERLKTADDENEKIREILASKLDNNTTKNFYNKIQKFSASAKFNRNEENEMLQIYQQMENINRAYEVLQAENNYLKRLIEKLTARVTLENITVNAEQSTDVGYLRREINSLRTECLLLRQIEDDYHRLKQQQISTNKLPRLSEQDAENIKAIIKERNSLREKCKSLKALEQEVKEFEHKTQEAKREAVDFNSTLTKQTKYIKEIEWEMQNMQKHYEEKMHCACLREECLKAQLEDLKDEIIKAKCEVQKADILSREVSCLRNEVLKRDVSLNDYDCQYKQLMDVITELQSVKLQSLNDNQTQTCKAEIDELSFYTCATLNEIMKELRRRGCFGAQFMSKNGQEPALQVSNIEYDKQCYQDLKRLQREVEVMKSKMQEADDCEFFCAESHGLEPVSRAANNEYDRECRQELQRLQQQVEEMRKKFLDAGPYDTGPASGANRSAHVKEMRNGEFKFTQEKVDATEKETQERVNYEVFCADALQRLKVLETENAELLQDKENLMEKFKEGERKMANMLMKIENLGKEIERNAQEANEVGKDLHGTINLVKDISEVQLKNQELVNAVSAINSRDDEKIIEDLRRQLEEEMIKLKKCQQDNADLLKDAKGHEMNLKALQDINNKLETDRRKLEADNNKLLNDNISLKQKLIFTPEDNEAHTVNTTDMIYMGTNNTIEYGGNEIPFESDEDQDIVKHSSKLQQCGTEIRQHSRTTSENNFKADNLERKDRSEGKEYPSRYKSNDADLDEFRYPSIESLNQNKQQLSGLDDFALSPANNVSKQQPSKAQQRTVDTVRKQPKRSQEKDKDDHKISTTLYTANKKPKAKNVDEHETYPRKNSNHKELSHDQQKNVALDDFVAKKCDTLKFNIQKGRCFEKEFRKILEEFILDCSFCFCRLFNTKSKLYVICHRLCHKGIDMLNFRDLAYLHRKIYAQADKLLPGCLLDMILSDHKEEVDRMLTSIQMPHLVDNNKLDTNADLKCCSCKSELCCNYSEELLKEKVNKLEKDIEIAREYLESLRNIPLASNASTDNGNSTDTNNSTYRASSPVVIQQKSRCLKYFKKLKNNTTKYPAFSEF